ncbi:MAG: type I restriction enzyme HsdR N-terminal domain-containing protein [Candidatus Cyclobacteriaceae bacterium M2_1C_046]
MRELNLPPISVEVKELKGKYHIFDIIRKKYILLTPEEWVRQHFIHYLCEHHGYPKGLIRVEGGLSYNRLLKRSDILIHDRQGDPYLLVECKSYDVKLNQKVIEQIAAYNKILNASYLMITNGLSHYCFAYNEEKDIYEIYNEIPVAPSK